MGDLQRINGTHREEFGASEIQVNNETAATAVAAQARAQVEARYVMALKRPRSMDEVRVRLLKECARPGFAAVARYIKPIGQDKTKWPQGPSIRFAEAAVRCMGNMYPEVMITFEDDRKRILSVTVTDLESNTTYSQSITVQKTVERQSVKDGQTIISSRINSYGKTVYLVTATEDDLLNKQNALISKSIRTNALRLLPGDILDECMEAVKRTLAGETKQDPEAAKRKIIDAFAALSVMPGDLAEYLGHGVERVSPSEIDELRQVYASIKDGEASWDDVMEARQPQGNEEEARKVGEAKVAAMKQQQQKPADAAPTEEPQAEVSDAAEPPVEQSEPAKRPSWGKK